MREFFTATSTIRPGTHDRLLAAKRGVRATSSRAAEYPNGNGGVGPGIHGDCAPRLAGKAKANTVSQDTEAVT